ncbi:MAG: ATP-binding protein [Chitinophagaceae bacterium]
MSCIKNKIKEAAQKCEPSWKEQYRFRCADGTYKYIQDRGYVIYENDLPVRMIGSLTDISQIKKLKDQLTNEKIRSHIEISETALRVQEMERTKIGQELHDNVNQILSTARLFVDITHPVTEKDQQAREKSLEYISLAIEEIRKLSKELAAPQLKEKGLADNIKIMIDDIHLASPIRFKLTYDHDLKLLSASKKIVLFRIVQEQVKNILKHSEAKTAGISFSVKNGEVILEIWDDGKGFIPQQTHQGIGLSNMRERVMMYDGKVDIDARPGKGCRLHVTLPVN